MHCGATARVLIRGIFSFIQLNYYYQICFFQKAQTPFSVYLSMVKVHFTPVYSISTRFCQLNPPPPLKKKSSLVECCYFYQDLQKRELRVIKEKHLILTLIM